jgi:hypothetical protein
LPQKSVPVSGDLLILEDSADSYTKKYCTVGSLPGGGGGGIMVYPAAGIAVSTGAAWTTSKTAPAGTIVGTSDSQTISNKSFGSGMAWPTFNQNTTGSSGSCTGNAAGLSGTPALPNGTTATTQSSSDDSTKIATTAYVTTAVAAVSGGSQYFALLQNRQTSGTGGGSTVAGLWDVSRVVPFNTEQEDANNIVDSSALPAFSLGAGTYRFEGFIPFYNFVAGQVRLWNVTDGTADVIGESVGSGTTYHTFVLEGTVTISGTKQFVIEYRVGNGSTTTGHGFPASLGTEIYGQLKIYKVQ